MKPYYECDGITIYHGDARDFLRVQATAFVTDPPYAMAESLDKDHGDLHRSGKAHYRAGFVDDAANLERVTVRVIEHWLTVVDAGALTCAPLNIWAYPKATDVGCFWRPAATTHGPWGMTVFTPILYYGRDWRRGKGQHPTGKQTTEAARQNGHPCPKPIKTWTWLVEKVCHPDGIVLDPFMGSGTTLVAAKNCNRRAIGVELEERYCEVAARRLDQGVLELNGLPEVPFGAISEDQTPP